MTLEQILRQRRTEKPVLLMTHVVCGYPSFDDNRRALPDFIRILFEDTVEAHKQTKKPSRRRKPASGAIAMLTGHERDEAFRHLGKVAFDLSEDFRKECRKVGLVPED